MEREQQYVGIDLHRRRSVIVRMNDAGEVLEVSRIDNDPVALSMAVAEAGPDPEVVLEACYGWYWAADLLQANGARVHLAHRSGCIETRAESRTMSRTPRSWPTGCAATTCPRRGLPPPRFARCGSGCATGPS